MYRNKVCRFLPLLVVALSYSCGGTGSSGEANAPASSPSPSTSSVLAVIDPSVPSSIGELIADVDSPAGTGTLNGRIPVPVLSTNQETLLFARTTAGQPVLASLVNSANVVSLSADSTARVLVRLALGSLSLNTTAGQIDSQISSAPSYPALVSQVTDALVAGLSPFATQSVLRRVISVANETTKAQVDIAERDRAQLLDSPRASNPLPFVFLDQWYTLSVVGSTGGGGAAIKNTFPIQ